MSLVVSPITNHANRKDSHRTGWGRMWANCLKADMAYNSDWSKEKTVYLEHGMEFKENSKGVNVFLKEEKSWDKLAEKAEMFCSFTGDMFSLDIPCPDYGARLKSRVRPHSSKKYKNLDFEKITQVCKNTKTIKQEGLFRNGLVLGDSHSLSAWRTDAYIERLDGKTLNGALNEGFSIFIDKYAWNSPSFLRVYFGNIDIRHHIDRISTSYEDKKNTIFDLTKRYEEELLKMQSKYCFSDIEVVAALPIENESRKLPKTGYYKDKPFWGSWSQRDDSRKMFNDKCYSFCEKNNFSLVNWPENFVNENSELDFEFMERPRSVHISPRYYMWDAFNNE